MPDGPSRRELLSAAAAETILMPQNSQHPEPLKSRADQLLERARQADAELTADRLKHPLKENSEPCFTYVPEPRQVRKR